MRIIAGDARGRVLRSPSGNATRPTDSRSRETLFNILGEHVQDAHVLDLYAGSGAVGLEALSRGARSCIFVEQNATAAASIRANLKMLGWADRGQVWHTAVKSALFRMDKAEEYAGHFGLVFADPPFREPREFEDLARRVDILARLLHNVGELSGGSSRILVVQHPKRMQFSLPAPFDVWKSRRAGESCLSFFEVIRDGVVTHPEARQDEAGRIQDQDEL